MNNTQSTLWIGLALVLTACGGSTGVASSKQALQMANLAVAQLQNMKANGAPSISSVPGANVGGTGGLKSTLTASCVQKLVASPIDADNDSIPVTQTFNFACSNEASGTSTFSYLGKYTIKDSDDTKKWLEGGYTGSYDFSSQSANPETSGTPAASWFYSGKGDFSGTKVGSSYRNDSTYKGSVKYSYSGISGEYTYDGVWAAKWTPASGIANMWVKGNVEFSGTWHYAGLIPNEGHDQNGKYSNSYGDIIMHMSSENLVYDTSCGKYYRSGSWLFDYGDGHIFKWTFDCNSSKYFLDGVEYDPNKQ